MSTKHEYGETSSWINLFFVRVRVILTQGRFYDTKHGPNSNGFHLANSLCASLFYEHCAFRQTSLNSCFVAEFIVICFILKWIHAPKDAWEVGSFCACFLNLRVLFRMNMGIFRGNSFTYIFFSLRLFDRPPQTQRDVTYFSCRRHTNTATTPNI